MIDELYRNGQARDLAMRLSHPYRGFQGEAIDQFIANAFHEEIVEQHLQHKLERETAEEGK